MADPTRTQTSERTRQRAQASARTEEQTREQTREQTHEQPRPLPHHVTTPLLALITEQALDEDYAHAARRRAEQAPTAPGTTPPRRRVGPPALAAAAVLGLLVTVAAVETDRGRGDRESGRASLVAEAGERRDDLSRAQERLAELRDANVADAASLADVTEQQDTVGSRLGRLGAVTGYGAVSGPGVRLTFDDPPDGDPADDMTQVLDGLWNAGAEAISINGRRVAALTRVASSGPAVSLDGRSLDPPYVVEAIGDPQTMPARFAESSSGSEFNLLAEALVFDVELETVDELDLPAASLPASLDLGPVDDGPPERGAP